MTLKNIIERDFLFMEATEKTTQTLKVFYKIDLKITNSEEEKEEISQQQPEQAPAAPTEPQSQPQEPPVDQVQSLPPETPPEPPKPPELPPDNTKRPSTPVASVQTEAEEDKEKITNDKEIVRKTEGDIILSKEEIDSIQTIEDLVDTLGEKDNKGERVLDEFSIETIKTLISPEAAQKAAQIINRDDHIFLDILYGRKKDDDNIGIRIAKRKKSDSVSCMILKDGDLLNTVFNVKIINDAIVELRNSILGGKN